MEYLLRNVAAVLPRFGKSLGGGAETLTKELVERLYGAGGCPQRIEKLEVWTTCAKDHRTWENFHPPGVTVEDGVTVRRFPVDPRDLEIFLQAEFAMRDGRRLTVEQQLDWLANSVNSRELYAHIAEHGQEFDALIFAPYLFATSFWGALIHPERSVLIPCLHDEHYAYQEVFRALFSKVRGIFFNAAPEQDLAATLYSLPELRTKGTVVGMGFEERNGEVAADAGKRFQDLKRPFLLYSGRKEQGKNLDLLIEYFGHYRKTHPERDLQLALIGAGEISFLEKLPEGVVDFGFVSEDEKRFLMREALALCQPSRNESFSIVIMEAWQESTPVIVHARCPVTRDHVVRSNGGLYFADAHEFVCVVDKLLSEDGLARTLGTLGREYVRTVYSWPAVLDRAVKGFERCGLASAAAN